MGAAFSGLEKVLSLIPADFVIAILPFVLHMANKLFDGVELLGLNALHKQLKLDDRVEVRTAIDNPVVFKSIGTYFRFDRVAHFILSLIIFCIISLLAAIAEHPTKNSAGLLVSGIVILMIFGAVFVIKLSRNLARMGEIDPLRRWRNIGYSLLLFTLITQVAAVSLH